MIRLATRPSDLPASLQPPGIAEGEGGYVLVAVMILLALLMLGLTIAAPQVSRDIQRDRELEAIRRGQQYARGIRLYYRRFGKFPISLDQLENTSNLRFIRKHYKDPLTNGEWKIVHQGEVKPEVLAQGRGFFGMGIFSPPTTMPAGVIQGLAAGVPTSVNAYGGAGGVTQLIDPATGQPTTSSSDVASSTQPDNQSTPQGSTTGTSGALAGNRSMVGVSSTNARKSIRIYKKQTHYNDWQFVYDPASDGFVGGSNQGVNTPGLTGPAPGVPLPSH